MKEAFFQVVIAGVDPDADIDIIKERIEIALAKELPFNDATVIADSIQ